MIPSRAEAFDCTEPRGKARISYGACLGRQEAKRTEWKSEVARSPWCAGRCPKGREVRALFGLEPIGAAPLEAVRGMREERKPCEECGKRRKHTAACSRPGRRGASIMAPPIVAPPIVAPPIVEDAFVARHACDLRLISDCDILACVAEAARRGLLPAQQERAA